MFFLDALTHYLHGLLHPQEQTGVLAPAAIDPAAVRKHLVHCLQRLSESAGSKNIKNLHELWSHGEAAVHFAQRLSELLQLSIAKDVPPQQLAEWVNIGLARQLGLPNALPDEVLTLELDHRANIAADDIFNAGHIGITDIDTYSLAIRTTYKVGSSLDVTPIGRAFLALTGKDAIRWLLQIEAAQSTGPTDPWRVSRETAGLLLKESPKELIWHKTPTIIPTPFLDWTTLSRLRALGLISIQLLFEAQRTVLKVLPLGEELLREIARAEESPMSLLANSLLNDLTLTAVRKSSVPHAELNPTASAHLSAAEATARQARLVAHEIRNSLVPVKTALGALYREVLITSPEEAVGHRRGSIDQGIDAAFRFVEQLVKIATLAVTPPEPFEPVSAVRDAISTIEQESGQRIEALLPPSLAPITGHRTRFVLAISNVLRNATQSVPKAAPHIRLQAESIDGARAVRITIEDNGPGVPENMRQAIFEEGISLRPGGSGLGLALVREVVEKEMKGLVGCDTSPLGGARFVLRVPTTGLERP